MADTITKPSTRPTYGQSDLQKPFADYNNASGPGWNWYRFIGMFPDIDPILQKNKLQFVHLRETMSESHTATSFNTLKSKVLALEGEFVGPTEDDKATDMMRGILKDLDEQEVNSQILNAMAYGYEMPEISYSKHYSSDFKTMWLPDCVDFKPQEWYLWHVPTPEEAATGLVPEWRFRELGHYYDGISLPQFKYIPIVHKGSYSRPYGEKLACATYWDTAFLRDTEMFLMDAEERIKNMGVYAVLPQGVLVTDADAATKARIDKMVEFVGDVAKGGKGVFEYGTVLQQLTNGTMAVPAYEIGHRILREKISRTFTGHSLTNTTSQTPQGSTEAAIEQMTDLASTGKRLCERFWNELTWIKTAVNDNSDLRKKRAMQNYDLRRQIEARLPVYKLNEEDKPAIEWAQLAVELTKSGAEVTAEFYKNRMRLKDNEFKITGIQPVSVPAPTPGKGV